MDDIEDDARYPPNPYGGSQQQVYDSSHRQKLPVRGVPYSGEVGSQYVDYEEEDDVDDEDDETELGEEEGNNNQNNSIVRYVGKDVDEYDNDDKDIDDYDDNDDEYNADEDGVKQKNLTWKPDDVDLGRHPKKRKLKSLVSSYEFAPRVPAPTVAPPASRPSSGGRNSLTDWNEQETFVLLDAWGDRFLQRGRKSLRSEEWQEVAEKVSEVSKIERTDTQCRNRLDTLKKKYKKEKLRMAETSETSSKWVYFKKMDMLMSSPQQQGGLSCGLDSGEYVFMNPKVYLSRANGLDEMRDSPANSESTNGEENDSDGLPPKKRTGRQPNDRCSIRLLADSIHKFSEIYEKTENTKRQQMLELEKMRMDFQRDLELQKRQIMERAQAEIAKIRQGVDDENDVSAENASG
ncbi:trihelix transcription factor ASIL1-like [Mangifera indica]|uniref:trihelix transcription factor ASIL1-like n=1 Tax=Mangifera indica TaxID=29780 RepID=UPI001CFB452B|nr:trihelix transcription factor ASIL1-like [Mangifera indica]XP_044485988.1 trihelix transcription factor ASIL1-like [Mangifera indica]